MNSKIKQVYAIDDKDLEELIKEELGLEIDIQAGKFSNGSFLSVEVIADPENVCDKEETIEKIQCREKLNYWDLDYTMNLLAQRGKIPDGNYIVTIWW